MTPGNNKCNENNKNVMVDQNPLVEASIDCSTTSSMSTSSVVVVERQQQPSLWDHYRSFVQRHHVWLELLEAGLSRILFWTPSTSSSSADDNGHHHRQRREVLCGLLSLHSLAMDTALQQLDTQQQQGGDGAGGLPRDFGATVRPNPESPSLGKDDDFLLLGGRISPTSLRIALTAVQSLVPCLLELASSSSSSSRVITTRKEKEERQARMRLSIERVKFALRVVLLGSYWKRLLQQQHTKWQSFVVPSGRKSANETILSPPLTIGLLAEGSLFHGIPQPY